ncbi:MAG: TIR domain-containing protein [Rhodospirillales bacterium]|nr:TIR domain-containing protein [Rhodospirillales bacterium]
MARNVFYSFHYAKDAWRASQVRNMGVVDGNSPIRDNDWEEVKKGGDKAIQKWIDEQLTGRSCAVVLVGAETANRPWVIHEISRAWSLGKGVVGIRIHNLLNEAKYKSSAGANPFDRVTFNNTGRALSSIVTLYNPPFTESTDVYADIKKRIEGLVEAAIKIRANN